MTVTPERSTYTPPGRLGDETSGPRTDPRFPPAMVEALATFGLDEVAGAPPVSANDDLPTVLDEAIAVGAKALWLQLGSWHEDVARRGEAAGLDVVMDRCVKIEHARFHGGLHLAGFDTGVISSKRTRG